MIYSKKIKDNYYLITQKLNNNKVVDTPKNVNHVVVIDVSYSMYHDLPLIKKQLKNKLSNLMKDGDTISIVWFSGNEEAGILKEEVEVKSLTTLSSLNNAIDKWLKPVGLTAFLKPLELVEELIERIKINRPDSVFSLIFQTDGWNNDCMWSDVTKTLNNLSNDLVAATFIEYGFYADSKAITEMASVVGGEKISCDGFDDYDPVFETKISSTINSGKKIVVDIDNEYQYDFAFSVDQNGSILLYNINNNQIMVNENVKTIHYFSPIGSDDNMTMRNQESLDTALYAAIYVLSDKIKFDESEDIVKILGDNYHYKQLTNAFGKQKLNSFKNAIKECVVDTTKRFPEGKSDIKPVDPNTYCFMNLIFDLGNIDGLLFYRNHPNFEYNLTGVKRIQKGSELSDEDKQRLSEAKNVDEATEILNELKEKNIELKFIEDDPDKGYPLKDLVWNSTRANLSIRVRITGRVDLPENKYGIKSIPTFKYRTYTLVKDGIVNVDKLPVIYSDELAQLLSDNNVKHLIYDDNNDIGINYGKTITIDIKSLPVINRSMVNSLSAKVLAEQEFQLMKIKADNKVYKYFREQYFPKTSKTFVDQYGKEATDWLKELGITDYNGFAPKTIAAESTDFYMSVNLKTKIKSLSPLPVVKKVIDKMEAGKNLTLSEWMLSDAINKFNEQLESDMYKSLPDDQKLSVLETYLNNKTKEENARKWRVLQEIAQQKFSLILSKKWFKEFTSFDENTLALKLDGKDLNFTFDMSEEQEAI